MSNNDGRFQDRLQFKEVGSTMSTVEIKSSSPVESIQSLDGYVLAGDDEVCLGDKLKTVLLDAIGTLQVFTDDENSLI